MLRKDKTARKSQGLTNIKAMKFVRLELVSSVKFYNMKQDGNLGYYILL